MINRFLHALNKPVFAIPLLLLPVKLPRKLKFFGYALKTFNQVRKSCFGEELDGDYREKIAAFESAFRDIGLDLQPVTPKVHVVLHHLADFVEENGPLGQFNEQTFESVHYAFANHMDTSKYTRNLDHPEHGKFLKKGVIDYNTLRIWKVWNAYLAKIRIQ